jgi:hypothetical protein
MAEPCAAGWTAAIVAQVVAPYKVIPQGMGRRMRLRSGYAVDLWRVPVLATPIPWRTLRWTDGAQTAQHSRVGVALTALYVSTTTALGWHGWLIAVVAAPLGFIYVLIGAPLAFGPEAPLRESEQPADWPDDEQLA